MTNVLMHGCNGRMGNMIASLAAEYPEITITAGVDRPETNSGNKSFPVYASLEEVKEPVDVIIDFSTASAVDTLLSYVEAKKVPAVICTTGLSEEQVARIDAVSKEVALLRSGNMSMGINTIIKVLKDISKTLCDAGFDVDIVEKHHKHKLDAPSGTALMLADAVSEGIGEKRDYVYDRSTRRMERPKEEIGISAVRGGTIVGEHDVIFAGADEIVEISHTALSRGVFANGALNAAMFLNGKAPGLYSMHDVVG